MNNKSDPQTTPMRYRVCWRYLGSEHIHYEQPVLYRRVADAWALTCNKINPAIFYWVEEVFPE